MTNEEAKVFLDNLKICINEHPVVADWLVEIANRKDEPSGSEIPNSCDTCRNKGVEGCEQPCLGCGCCGLYEPKDEPITQMKTQNSNLTFEKDECAKEYEELGLKELKELIEADRKTEPTSSKMEQVDKDINVRSKDEPTPWCKYCQRRWENDCVGVAQCIRDMQMIAELYKASEDEPQTEVVMPKKCKGCDSASKIIEAYSRGFEDGAEAVKAMPDCEACELDGKADVCKVCRVSNYERQPDCAWK